MLRDRHSHAHVVKCIHKNCRTGNRIGTVDLVELIARNDYWDNHDVAKSNKVNQLKMNSSL